MYPTPNQCRAMVTDPVVATLCPAAAQTAWIALKEQHGHPIDCARLSRLEAMPSHFAQTGPAQYSDLVAEIDAARARTSEKVRTLFSRDAGGAA